MQPAKLAALALLLVLALPAAGAAVGSSLEANDPILLTGRTDAGYTPGVVSFVAARADTPLAFQASARELRYNATTYTPPADCGPSTALPAGGCAPKLDSQADVLRDAKVTLVGATSPYKLALTNNRSQADPSPSFGAPGPLVATTGASTILGTNAKAEHLSAYEDDWSDDAQRLAGEPFYDAQPNAAKLTASGGTVSAGGGFRALAQGLKVHVAGTSLATGKPVALDLDTATSAQTVRFLVLEATDGRFEAQSDAPFTGYGASLVDVHGAAQLANANGTAQVGSQSYSGALGDVSLPGPFEMVLGKIRPGDPARIAFGVSDRLHVLDQAPNDPESKPNYGALAAAGLAGAGGAGLLAAALYFWPRLRFAFTALLLPLYSRIERTEVLEHAKRDEIYELIRASPGIHAHEIGERALIGWGTTVYHLKLLENHGLVVSKKSGRYKRFFVNTGEYTKKKDVYGALRNETAKNVAQYVVDHPGCTQKELCAAVGIQPSLASWHVEKLEGVGLVKRVKDGRQVRYFAGPAWADLNVRVDPAGGADGVAET